jgi:3-methyladenine DNA glycosylase AlkD
MTTDEALAALESLGTEQNRKTYGRHGVCGPMYGVSYANLNALKKKVKVDHELACGLWESGVHDARIFALMVADPKKAEAKQIVEWSKALDNSVITDALACFAGKTPHARPLMEKWTRSDEEYLGAAGWHILSTIAMDAADLGDEYFEPYLVTVERDVHASKNRTRHSMMGALIAIGGRSEPLRDKAIAAARRIGHVEVDYGDTNCKTPEPEPYIAKMWARKKR